MKTVRTLTVLLPIVLLFLFNLMCKNDSSITNPVDSRKQFVTDGPGEKIDLFIDEYVKVIPASAPPYYEWRQTASFQCITCVQYPRIDSSNFTTPDSIRYEGSNRIETQYFRFIKDGHWDCRSVNDAAYYKIYTNSQTYLEHWEPFFGVTTGCGACQVTGTYSNTDNNQRLPEHTTIKVKYGVDIIVSGCDG